MSGGEDNGHDEEIVNDAEEIVLNVVRGVCDEITSEVEPGIVRQFEKNDFDATFSDVLRKTMKAPLDLGLASPFGIRLHFFQDIEVVELNPDIEYDGSSSIEFVDRGDDGIANLRAILSPGSLAVDEIEAVLDEYAMDGTIDSVRTTTAFQIYSAGIITKAYFGALSKEAIDGVDPYQHKRLDYLIDYLVDEDLVKESISAADFETDRLSHHLSYLPNKSILRINQHRLSAGIFIRSLDVRESQVIVQAARAYLDDFLISLESLTKTTSLDQSKVSKPDDLDTYLKQKKEAASYLSLQVIGIAFPMTEIETDVLYRIIETDIP